MTDKLTTTTKSRPIGSIGSGIPICDQIDQEEFINLIWKYNGIISLVCNHLDVNYPQFWRAIRKWGLEEELKRAKEAYLDKAQKVLIDSMDSESEITRLKAAEVALKYSSPKSAQEITVRNGDTETTVRSIFGVD